MIWYTHLQMWPRSFSLRMQNPAEIGCILKGKNRLLYFTDDEPLRKVIIPSLNI
jgi:hypothetical protein